jgi:hypothetical protein
MAKIVIYHWAISKQFFIQPAYLSQSFVFEPPFNFGKNLFIVKSIFAIFGGNKKITKYAYTHFEENYQDFE